MLRSVALAGVPLVALSASVSAQTMPPAGTTEVSALASKTAAPSYNFWQSIGVNFHAEYDAAAGLAANPYNDLGKVIAGINYLGLKAIRASPGGDGFGRMEQVARATGAKFSFFFTSGWGQTYQSQAALANGVLGSGDNWIMAIENANEVDNWPPTFNGQGGMAGAAAQERQVWTDFANSGVPVYASSIGNPAHLGALGDLSGTATYSNAHTYPPNGNGATDWLASWLPQSQAATPGLPFFVQTEAGYSTNGPQQTAFNGSVSERAHARLILNLLAASYKAGVAETFLYELVDSDPTGGNCDPGGANRELHFGLFRCDWSAKPGAVALANMTAVVRDAQPTAATGGALNFTVTGIPAYKTLLLSRTGGGFVLVVWAEPTVFDAASLRDVVVAPARGTVSFGETAKSVAVYDPLVGAEQGADASVTAGGPPTPTPVKTAANVASIDIEVADHPVLILLNGTTGSGGNGLVSRAMAAVVTPTADAPAATDEAVSGEVATGEAAAAQSGADSYVAADGSTVFLPPSASQAASAPANDSTSASAGSRHRHHQASRNTSSAGNTSSGDTGSTGTGGTIGASKTSSTSGTSNDTNTGTSSQSATTATPVAAAGVPAGVGAQTFGTNFSDPSAINSFATNFNEWNVNTLSGNGEMETYTGPGSGINCYNPFSSSGGSLVMTGVPTPASCQGQVGTPYVSGMLDSSATFSQKYGYFDITAQIPSGKGTWPALWLTSQTSAGVYEIDIVEAIGEANTIHFSIHVPGQDGSTQAVTLPFDPSAGLHTYGVLWTATTATLYVDGTPRASADATGLQSAPAMHWIVANGIGGNWPGSPNSSTPMPVTMRVQSINAYAN